VTGGVDDGEGEVRSAAGDERELERCDRTLDVLGEPGGDAVDVDAVHGDRP
jgi:hypothetical protein